MKLGLSDGEGNRVKILFIIKYIHLYWPFNLSYAILAALYVLFRGVIMPTVVSLFSGCGGSDLGLHWAGFETLMSNDIFSYAKTVYEANLPETDFVAEDIRKIKSFPSADLLVGCYPCQGFSQGGARDPSRKVNYLYREFDRALRLIKPKAFVVENVSGMKRANFQHLLNNQITRFRMAGYRVSHQILNAVDYGVAQERKRLFIVGIRSDFNIRYEFPMPTHDENNIVSQQDVIGGMPIWPEGEFDDHEFHWYYLSRDRYRSWDQPSKTIVAGMRNMPLHPSSPRLIKHAHNDWRFRSDMPARKLSYNEAARLQGFPADFVLPDEANISYKYTAVGNAVPPPLMEAVANNLPEIW